MTEIQDPKKFIVSSITRADVKAAALTLEAGRDHLHLRNISLATRRFQMRESMEYFAIVSARAEALIGIDQQKVGINVLRNGIRRADALHARGTDWAKDAAFGLRSLLMETLLSVDKFPGRPGEFEIFAQHASELSTTIPGIMHYRHARFLLDNGKQARAVNAYLNAIESYTHEAVDRRREIITAALEGAQVIVQDMYDGNTRRAKTVTALLATAESHMQEDLPATWRNFVQVELLRVRAVLAFHMQDDTRASTLFEQAYELALSQNPAQVAQFASAAISHAYLQYKRGDLGGAHETLARVLPVSGAKRMQDVTMFPDYQVVLQMILSAYDQVDLPPDMMAM